MGESRENHKTTQVWTKSNPLLLNSGSDEQIQGIRPDRVPEELGQRFITLKGGSDQDHPQEKEMQKGKMSDQALQITEKREEKGKGEKER